jgi:hypothetical protein
MKRLRVEGGGKIFDLGFIQRVTSTDKALPDCKIFQVQPSRLRRCSSLEGCLLLIAHL